MEIIELLPFVLGLGLLLGFSAFFSGSETALCALTKVQVERLRRDPRKNSIRIVSLVDDPRRLFISVLLGNVFVNIAFATMSAALIYRLAAGSETAAGSDPTSASSLTVTATTLFITLLLLVFGEITPKTFAITHAEAIARGTAPLLWGFSVLIAPARVSLQLVTDLLLPIFGGGETASEAEVTADDFLAAVHTKKTVLQHDEHKMLENILTLREIEATEVMVPRTAMVAMSTQSRIEEVLAQARAMGLSRIPIYRDQVDHICGVFHTKDVPLWQGIDVRSQTVAEFLDSRQAHPDDLKDTLVRPPFFAYASTKLTVLFTALTQARTKIAILVDEYGGVAGSVTTEDIIEEIVGDILDKRDLGRSVPDICPIPGAPGSIMLTGRTSVRAINRRFHLKIDETIADSIGGYLLAQCGRIPDKGETIVDDNDIHFEIVAMSGRAISSVRMTPSSSTAAPGTGSNHA